jgi:hypothetical protein
LWFNHHLIFVIIVGRFDALPIAQFHEV